MYIHVHIQDSNTHTLAAHARVLDLNLSYYFASKMRKITEESVRLVTLIIINFSLVLSSPAGHVHRLGTRGNGYRFAVRARWAGRPGAAGRARDYLIIIDITILACAGRQSAHPCTIYFR